MKKRKTSLAFVLFALGATPLMATGCGDGGSGTGDNLVEKTCGSCGEKIKVAADEKTCPKCKGPIAAADCPPHEWGEYVVKTEPTQAADGVKVATCSKCGITKEQPIPALGFEYNLTIKDAAGSVIKSEKVRSINKIEKPADPTAPAGQVFYGWKNVLNGGQIWNFEDDVLGLPKADVELVPCFIPADMAPQYIETEFAPAITAGGGMDGATYSGGAKGKGMIQMDQNYQYGAGCEIEPFQYYEDPTTFKPVVIDETHPLPSGQEAITVNPKADKKGYFFHFNYINGNELIFNIVSSKAVTDATIFARFSAEYGLMSSTTGDRTSTFTDEEFPIKVNGTKLAYGTITLHNIPAVGSFLPFQDYMLSANVSLNAGNNVISMKVNNTNSVNGTLAATSPCVDALKVYTSAALTWSEAALANIIGD